MSIAFDLVLMGLGLYLMAAGVAPSAMGVIFIAVAFGGGMALGGVLGARHIQNKWSASHEEIYGP